MGIAKEVLFGDSVRERLMKGINILDEAVGTTLGPKGRNVLLDKGTHPIVTKDGVSVAREINFSDKYMNLGCQVVKDAAIKTNHIAGDGTTTATVLASQFAREGMRLVSSVGGYDPHLIKIGMNLALTEILEKLEKNKRVIKDAESIYNVAMISANNDPNVGKSIREAFEGIGDLGIVSIGTSLNEKTQVKFSSGLELSKGYISSAFANLKDGSCEYKDPKILLSLKPINDYKDIISVVDYCSKQKINLVIIAPEFEEEVEAFLLANQKKGVVKLCMVKTPGWSITQIEDYTDDIAILTSASPLYKDGLYPENFDVKHLGTCESIRMWPQRTIITGANTNDDALDAYCNILIAELETEKDSMSQSQIDSYKERLAKLNGGIATILVGATTEIEMIELKHRYEDAVNSVRAAVSEGVVVGGGCALAHISKSMKEPKLDKSYNDEAKSSILAGYKLVKIGILAPLKRIIQNASKSIDGIVESVQKKKFEYGYNAKDDKIQNLFDAGVIDPILVTRTALSNAVSIASTLLTTQCVVTNEAKNVRQESNDPVMDEFNMQALL